MKKTISISAELDDRFRQFCDHYHLTREEAISKMLTYCNPIRKKHSLICFFGFATIKSHQPIT